MILPGKNLVIKLGGTAIAAAKSCRIIVNCDSFEVANANDGKWKRYMLGRMSWSVQVSHLIVADTSSSTPVKSLIQRVGQSYTLSFECSQLSGDTMSGTANCKNFNVNAAINSLMTGSYEFEGSGALS